MSLWTLRSSVSVASAALVLLLGAMGGCAAPSEPNEPAGAGGSTSGGSAAPTTGGAGEGGSGGNVATVRAIRKSSLGEGCSSASDCEASLACIRGLCQSSSTGVAATGLACYQIDCKDDADCCGKKSSDVPEACQGRAARCSPLLPGCTEVACSESSQCLGGGTCAGRCALTEGECRGAADCLRNLCNSGHCALDFGECTQDADCSINACTGGTCECENAAYNPNDPICDDPTCEDFCEWTCQGERCMFDSGCSVDDDCLGSASICSDGQCVECRVDLECPLGRSCREGRCEDTCQDDLNCGLFEACVSGKCEYIGCKTDRECVVWAANSAEWAGVEARLLRCARPSPTSPGACVLPCETDAECGPTEACSDGFCEYLGCETDSECRVILGQTGVSPEGEPWVPQAVCR